LLSKEESVQTLTVSNQNFKEDIENLTANYTDEKHRRLELQKSSQEFSTRLADKTKMAETATLELKSLQARFTEQKEKMFKLKGEKESLTFSLESQKTNFSRATREANALKNKTAELKRNSEALAKTKAEYEELQAKFTTTNDDMEVLRKLCAIQKQKLEKYAAITGGSTGNEVFIHKDKSLSADADYKPHLKAIS